MQIYNNLYSTATQLDIPFSIIPAPLCQYTFIVRNDMSFVKSFSMYFFFRTDIYFYCIDMDVELLVPKDKVLQ